MFVSIGSRNSFGVFVDVWSDPDGMGWSVTMISVAATIGMVASGLFQPFLGWFYDNLGGRKVIIMGLLILGTCTLLLSLTPNILYLILIYGLVASIGASATSFGPPAALLTRWFRRRRATALGIGVSGASAGGLLLVPFAWYLLDATGSWRLVWLAMGVIVLVAVPLAYLLLRNDPKDMGLQPDGDEEPTQANGGSAFTPKRGPLEVEYLTESFHSPPFWQLAGSYFVCGATTGVISVHFIKHAINEGVSGSTASLAFGMMMGLNIVGVIVATALADKFPRKNLLGLVYGGRGLGYAVLLLAPEPWAIWGFASIVGFSWIATAPLSTSLTADVYGLKYVGTLSGLMTMGHQLGSAASILFAGIMFDLTGSYDLPFAIVGSLLFFATLSAFSIKEKRFSARYQAVPATTGASSLAD